MFTNLQHLHNILLIKLKEISLAHIVSLWSLVGTNSLCFEGESGNTPLHSAGCPFQRLLLNGQPS